MKHLLPATIIFFSLQATAQQFINGDFENTTAVGCNYNLLNADFNSLMSNTIAFGLNEEVDIQQGACYEVAPSGTTFISLAVETGTLLVDQVSMELTSPLIAGHQYTLSFFARADTEFNDHTVDSLLIGVSGSPTAFGQQVFSMWPNKYQWESITCSFTAPSAGGYITASNQGLQYAWVFVDDFVLGKSTGTGEVVTDPISVYVIPRQQIITHAGTIITSCALYNVCGQLIQQQHPAATDFSLPVNHCSSGVYVLQLQMADGRIVCRKVVL